MRARLDVWGTDIDKNNNTSTVNARVVIYRENNWLGDTYDDRTYIKLQMGSVTSVEETRPIRHNKSMGEIVVAEGAITVTHNSSGGGSRTISVNIYSNITANFRGSTTMEFTLSNTGGGTPPDPPSTISNPTLSDNSILVPSNSGLTVYSNASSSRYRHEVKIKDGQQILLEEGLFSSSCYFSSSELRNALLQRLRESSSLSLTVNMKTYRDGSYIGEASTSLIANFNNNTPPNPADFIYRDTNSATQQFSAINDRPIFIQNQSNLVIEIPASMKGSSNYNIPIRNYSASVGKTTKTASYSSSSTVLMDMGKLDLFGTKPITLITYDDNYSSAIRTKDIDIIPYQTPVIKAVAERVNIDSNDVILRINGIFSSIQIDGQARNIIDANTGVKWRYKESSGSFTDWVYRPAATSISGDLGTLSTPDLALTLDKNKDYLFEVQVLDLLNTVTLNFSVSIGVPKVWIGEDGRNAVGGLPTKTLKPTDAANLEVFGTIYSNGKEVAVIEEDTSGAPISSCPYEIGDIYITTSPAYSTSQAVAQRWPGTSWERYAEGRTLVGYDSYQGEFNAINKTGGAKTVSISISQMPSHNHRIYSGYTDEYAEKDAFRYQYWARQSRRYNMGNTGLPFIEHTGGGNSHNNLQPYITTYMWRRVS